MSRDCFRHDFQHLAEKQLVRPDRLQTLPCPPAACRKVVKWKGRFVGCPRVSVCDGARMQMCKSNRAWMPDINQAVMATQMDLGAEWDPYQHFMAVDYLRQFLSTDMNSIRDWYLRDISQQYWRPAAQK